MISYQLDFLLCTKFEQKSFSSPKTNRISYKIILHFMFSKQHNIHCYEKSYLLNICTSIYQQSLYIVMYSIKSFALNEQIKYIGIICLQQPSIGSLVIKEFKTCYSNLFTSRIQNKRN